MKYVVLMSLLVGCGSVNGAPEDARPKSDASGDGTGSGQPEPTIASLAPDWGVSAGGTRVTIRGSGFTVTGLAVKVGGVSVTPTLVDDSALTIVTPVNPIAPADVVVSTAGGTTAPLKFRYFAPMYAADGQGTVGNLYIVDPVTAIATVVGPLNFGVTGMAFSPDGVLFGATTGGGPVASTPTLIKIDPYTATATPVGILKTAANVAAGASDIAFVGSTLHGWRAKTLMTIDTTTGIVTLAADTLGGVTGRTRGNGIAALNGSLFVAPANANGSIFSVDRASGVATPAATLVGPTQPIGAMTVVGTTLLASVTPASGNPRPPAVLMSVNPSTGATLTVGNFRTTATPLSSIDAIAGIAAQP